MPQSQPNILWITTDRQRWDALGCYGNEWATTPNLDALAREGVVMDAAYAQCAICGPSRASFMTGRYPRVTGVNRNAQRINPSEKLISRLLADAGYRCGHGGKMHLAPSSPPIADWCEPRTDDGYRVFEWSMHPPDKPVCQYTAWLAEHDIEFSREPVNGSKYVTFGMDEQTSNTAWIAQRAVNFMKVSKDLDSPWFYTCNIEDPHDPIDPPRRFLEPYLDRLDEIPLPEFDPRELEEKPKFLNNCYRLGAYGNGKPGSGFFAYEPMTDDDHRLIRAGYWAMIDHIDYQVGRIIETLKQTGQYENTLIVFMSDHGEMLGDHGCYFQGPYFYEPMMRVPLLVRLPGGGSQGVRASAMVELVDLAPTFMEAAGLEPYAGMQGRSLWPMLKGEASREHHREDVYYEYYRAIPGGHQNMGDGKVGGGYLTGVRTRDYALTAVHDHDTGELYDLSADPGEVHNLWNDPAYAQVKIDMLKRLCDRMAGTIDPLPVTEASY